MNKLKQFAGKLTTPYFNRFVFFGGLNTGITYVTYLILLRYMPYSVAYTATFIQGMALAYFFYCKYVFRSRLAIKQFAKYPFFYLVQYVVSILLLKIFVTEFHMNPSLVPAVIIVFFIPASYIMNKFILL